MTSKKYSRETRAEAVALMVLHGNSLVVSDLIGVPGSTLRHWQRHDEEFQSMYQQTWLEFGEEIKANLAQIVKESGEQVLDRLRLGDVIRDPRTGEQIRIPVKVRDLAIAGAIAFDKLALAESRPTSIIQHESSETQVMRLAEQFRAISEAGRRADAERKLKQS